jgi:YHS domain-containing protein
VIRYFVLRIVLPVVLFLILRAVIKSIFAKPRTAVTPSPSPSQSQPGGELKKDPVCGTYVSVGAAVTRAVKGTTLYFCSAACRDKYVG